MRISASKSDATCREPRAALLHRGASVLFSFAAVLVLNGCSLILDPDPCPDVLCEEGCATVEGEDGCMTCSDDCEPPVGNVCFDSSECASGERCDTENFCEPPPGCEDGQPCPDVCYGRCVDEPTGCTDDADCAADEFCRRGQAVVGDGAAPPGGDEGDGFRQPDEPDQPGDGDGEGETMPAPLPPEEPGICVPAGCPERLALPACPPGTELVIDFSDDECGSARCIPTSDTCRNLGQEACEEAPGCHLEEIYSGCDCGGGAPGSEDGAADRLCDCAIEVEVICVENNDCEDLGPEACAQNPDCVGEYYATGGGCPDIACPDGASCDPIACDTEYYEEFICLPRTDDGCYGGGDCPPGTVCVHETVCTEVCWEAEDGTGGCDRECWEEEGFCAPSEDDCWNLPVEVCEDRPDCMIDWVSPPCACDEPNGDCACPDIAEAICVPVPNQDCYSDNDCGFNQFCDLQIFCPDCVDGDDIGCAAPCHVQGVCRDGGPPPTGCVDSDDCGAGYTCESVTLCEDCAPPDPDGEGFMEPAPCEGACWNEGICVPDQNVTYCGSDDECSEEEFCNFDSCYADPTCPECDVCAHICEPRVVVDVCWDSIDCEGGQVCDITNYCEASPDCQAGEPCDAVCYGRCVDPEPPPGGCLSDNDCGQGQRCATEQDNCFCPDGQMCETCFSECVETDPGGICYSDNDCGNGQQCVYLDEACGGSGSGDPDNGMGAPIIACEGTCESVTDPPEPECFTNDDCAMFGSDYQCVEDPNCDPNEDFCPARCQQVDCAQVITHATNPETGSCVEFATPCDVPDGWQVVMGCEP